METKQSHVTSMVVLMALLLCLGVEYMASRYYSFVAFKDDQQQAQSFFALAAKIRHPEINYSDRNILSFRFEKPAAEGVIDAGKHTIEVLLPPDADLLDRAPLIEVSPGATVTPASGVPQDFLSPVVYTVKAPNGSLQQYKVVVTTRSVLQSVSSEKKITAFVIDALKGATKVTIQEKAHTISVVVPSTTDLAHIAPTIIVSPKATLQPKSGATQDFTQPVTYTVTAEDGSTQEYKVTIVHDTKSG